MSKMRLTCGPVQLRMVTPRSAHQLYRLAREEQLTTHLQWQPHRSVADSLAYIEDARRLWEHRRAFLPGIYEVEYERLVGATGISQIDRVNQRAEVGTWIGLPHQSRGLNRYCKAAVFALGFEVLGLHRLELVIRTDNERSLRATARLPGIIDEGVQHMRLWKDGVGHDARMFAITSQTYAPAEYPEVRIENALS